MGSLDKTISKIEPVDKDWRQKARARLDDLAIPRGSLGRLLHLAEDLAGITRSMNPRLDKKVIVTMAGDHGVVAEGVSAFPQEVTAQMVNNFVRGGAGINVLARLAGARVVVVDMGVAADLSALVKESKIVSKSVAKGTRNIAKGPAMSREEAIKSIENGVEAVHEIAQDGLDLLGVGDMGIGNTTPSSAIAAAITGKPASEVTGRGTGIGDSALKNKIRVIETALSLNKPDASDPIDVLSKVGGFEIGGITGCVLAGASMKIPVIIDGLISTAGALIATELCPSAKQYVIASHNSVEIGHRAMHERIGVAPYLDLNMRLGEGTGAALTMHLVEASKRILTEMLTFSEAKVTDGNK